MIDLDDQVSNNGFAGWVYNGYAAAGGKELCELLRSRILRSPRVSDNTRRALAALRKVLHRVEHARTKRMAKGLPDTTQPDIGNTDRIDNTYYTLRPFFLDEVEAYLAAEFPEGAAAAFRKVQMVENVQQANRELEEKERRDCEFNAEAAVRLRKRMHALVDKIGTIDEIKAVAALLRTLGDYVGGKP